MEIAIVVLSIAVLGAVILLVFMHNSNVMSAQAIEQLHKEVDQLQEKRIEEIKEHAKANELALQRMTEAAQLHSQSSQSVAMKIEEAIEVMNGNQYAIMMKLDKLTDR